MNIAYLPQHLNFASSHHHPQQQPQLSFLRNDDDEEEQEERLVCPTTTKGKSKKTRTKIRRSKSNDEGISRKPAVSRLLGTKSQRSSRSVCLDDDSSNHSRRSRASSSSSSVRRKRTDTKNSRRDRSARSPVRRTKTEADKNNRKHKTISRQRTFDHPSPASKNKTSTKKKQLGCIGSVCFHAGKDAVQFVEPPEAHKDVELSVLWYSNKDLKMLMDHELRIILRSTNDSRHKKHRCARGMEHLLAGEDKGAKIATYVLKILKAQKEQCMSDASDGTNATTTTTSTSKARKELRAYSQSLTKEDRKRAYRLGFQDASEVQVMTEESNKHCGEQQRRSLSPPKTSRTILTTPASILKKAANPNSATRTTYRPEMLPMGESLQILVDTHAPKLGESIRTLKDTPAHLGESLRNQWMDTSSHVRESLRDTSSHVRESIRNLGGGSSSISRS